MRILATRDDNKKKTQVLADEVDAEILGAWKWRVTHNGYVYRNAWIAGRNRRLYIHRAIMGIANMGRSIEVDHISGDKLDNRRANLRLCTRGHHNASNPTIGRERSYSKYRGVTYAKDKPTKPWQAQIGMHGKNKVLGRFLTQEEAARAYDKAARQFYGEFACLNFPDP